MVCHCDEAVENPSDTMYPSNPMAWLCNDCVVDRSLASLLSDYNVAKTRQGGEKMAKKSRDPRGFS